MIVVYITSAFMLLGLIDKIVLSGKLGYGEKFDEGIMAMGSLALSMAGIMCLAPLLGKYLAPVTRSIFRIFGADPAMISGIILACDTGGYPLAVSMTTDAQIQMLSGIFVGAMMGATVVFSIPVSLSIIRKEDRPFLAKGILAGFIAVPFGAFAAAVIAGISPAKALINLIPLIILSVLLALGMALIPEKMLKGFEVFAKLITIIIHIGLGAGIIEALLGITVIPGMDPIGPQLETVGIIAVTLAGAYPMVLFITRHFSKPLIALGKLMGIGKDAAAGMVACLANNIPMFGMMKDMDDRGKVIAVAFSVCASFALGDHLGYASAECSSATLPMVLGKIIGGIVGILIAGLLTGKETSSGTAGAES